MPKETPEKDQYVQCELFEDDRYTYRIFCTDFRQKAHKVIAQYDKRADVENLVGESKKEGLDAIPSSRFKNNYAFFQIVMLAVVAERIADGGILHLIKQWLKARS